MCESNEKNKPEETSVISVSTSKNDNKVKLFNVIFGLISIVAALVSTFLTVYVSYINRNIENNKILPDFLGILKQDNPAFLQGVALSELTKRSIINFDSAFEIAYRIEDSHKEGVVGWLFDQYKESNVIIKKPIGYLEIMTSSNTPENCKVHDSRKQYLYINGWAINTSNIEVWVGKDKVDNNKKIHFVNQNCNKRKDIDGFVRKFDSRYDNKTPGFTIALAKNKIPKRPFMLKVRLVNKDDLFVVIYSSLVPDLPE